MKSWKTSLCGLALCGALWGAPVALADEGGGGGGGGSWLQVLVEMIEEIILGPPPSEDAPNTLVDPELGELYPPGG